MGSPLRMLEKRTAKRKLLPEKRVSNKRENCGGYACDRIDIKDQTANKCFVQHKEYSQIWCTALSSLPPFHFNDEEEPMTHRNIPLVCMAHRRTSRSGSRELMKGCARATIRKHCIDLTGCQRNSRNLSKPSMKLSQANVLSAEGLMWAVFSMRGKACVTHHDQDPCVSHHDQDPCSCKRMNDGCISWMWTESEKTEKRAAIA